MPLHWPYSTLHNDTQYTGTQHNDTQHNDIQHTDTQHNDTQHNDIQHNNKKCDTQLKYTLRKAGCCSVSFLPSVSNKPFMLSVISAELLRAECHYAGCRYAECRGAILSTTLRSPTNA